MLSTADKQGGVPFTSYETNDFLSFVTSVALEDLASIGCNFI